LVPVGVKVRSDNRVQVIVTLLLLLFLVQRLLTVVASLDLGLGLGFGAGTAGAGSGACGGAGGVSATQTQRNTVAVAIAVAVGIGVSSLLRLSFSRNDGSHRLGLDLGGLCQCDNAAVTPLRPPHRCVGVVADAGATAVDTAAPVANVAQGAAGRATEARTNQGGPTVRTRTGSASGACDGGGCSRQRRCRC
jgi:hypothetical protein